MSLFVQFKSIHGSKRLFRVRDHYSALGKNNRGVLTDQSPDKLILEIIRKSKSYKIINKILNEEFEIQENETCLIHAEDYDITFKSTHVVSEFMSLPKSPLTLKQSYASAEISFLNSQIVCPLFEDYPCSIGSASSCSIHLPFKGILPLHAELLLKDETLYFKAEERNIEFLDDKLLILPLSLPIIFKGIQNVERFTNVIN